MLPEYRTILCALDLGRTAPRVLAHAVGLAARYGGSVIALHVVEPLGPSARHMFELYAGEELAHREEQRWQQLQDQVRERLRDFCEAEGCCDAAGRPLVADIRVLRGRPSAVICQEAARARADVVVLGAHGHSTVGEILLGSTAHRVSQHAPVPVLLVRTSESAAGSSC